MEDRDVAGMIARLARLVAGQEPEALRRAYLSTPIEGQPLFEGTTVPMLGALMETASGLLVPAASVQRPGPLDLMKVYLTASELMPSERDLSWCRSRLATLPLSYVLDFISSINVRLHKAMTRREADEEAARSWFVPELSQRVLNLIASGRALLNEQAGMVLAKMAIEVCDDDSRAVGEEGVLVPVMLLVVADNLSAGGLADTDDRTARLEAEVVANQYFNAPLDPAHLAGRFVRRWLEIPHALEVTPAFDLEETYQSATGCSLSDLSTFALAVWAGADVGRTRFSKAFFTPLNWDEERLDRLWLLLSADRNQMLEALQAEADKLGPDSIRWAFSAMERFPLYRMNDGSIVLLNPNMLLRRVFGWLPFFDVRESLTGSRRKQFENFFRRATEAYAVEALTSIAHERALKIYDEEQLKAAYAADGVQIADAVIDYVDAFVVVEVSTRQLMRPTATGTSPAALQDDLLAVMEKARQVDSTINQLRANEQRLTGLPRALGRRFHPIVVVTEGFPVNPITLTRLRQAVATEGLLMGDDVEPLEIMDIVELEMVEALQEADGPGFRDVLLSKAAGGLAKAAIRDHIVVELRQQPGRPRRLEQLWQRPFDDAARALQEELPKEQPAPE